jgi:hypothetical protein
VGLDDVSTCQVPVSGPVAGRSRTSGLPEENTNGVISDWDAPCVHVVGQRSRSLQQISSSRTRRAATTNVQDVKMVELQVSLPVHTYG